MVGVVPVVDGVVVMVPLEVVPGEIVPLLLGVVVMVPLWSVGVGGVVVVGVVVPFGTVVNVVEVVVLGFVVVVPGVVVVPVVPMALLFVVPVTPLFWVGVVVELVVVVPLCWPPGSEVVGAGTGALIVAGVVLVPAAPVWFVVPVVPVVD